MAFGRPEADACTDLQRGEQEASSENARLRLLLQENQRLLKEKELELQQQSELARLDCIPTEVRHCCMLAGHRPRTDGSVLAAAQANVDDEQMLARMRDFGARHAALAAKVAASSATADEIEEELFLRADLNDLRMQLGLSTAPAALEPCVASRPLARSRVRRQSAERRVRAGWSCWGCQLSRTMHPARHRRSRASAR